MSDPIVESSARQSKKDLSNLLRSQGHTGLSKLKVADLKALVGKEPIKQDKAPNPWSAALKIYNSDKPTYCIPKKDSTQYAEVMKIKHDILNPKPVEVLVEKPKPALKKKPAVKKA